MISFLIKPKTLWVLFALFVAESLVFGLVMIVWNFTIIDEISDPSKVQQHISALTETQRSVHLWTTATLDVAYPLTYGLLFAGLALRSFRPVFSIPGFAVIPFDLTEGVVQVMVLAGNENLLWLKAYVTPIKLLLFIIAIGIGLVAIAPAIKQRFST